MKCVCVLTFLLLNAVAAVAQPFNANVVYFRYERGAAVPPAQTITLSEDDQRSLQLLSTVGAWLKPSILSDPLPGKLRIAVDPAGLTPGIYEGNVLLLA